MNRFSSTRVLGFVSFIICGSTASSISQRAILQSTFPKNEDLFINVEARPRSKLEPCLLWIILYLLASKSEMILDVVVFPFVPQIIIEPLVICFEYFLTKFGSKLSA